MCGGLVDILKCLTNLATRPFLKATRHFPNRERKSPGQSATWSPYNVNSRSGALRVIICNSNYNKLALGYWLFHFYLGFLSFITVNLLQVETSVEDNKYTGDYWNM